MSSPTRTGHVAIAGAPNAGKSSLLNRLVGAHLAIVSPKAQTTRLPVVGLYTTSDTQLILHDLPGLLEPRYPMQERMRALAEATLREVDVVLHIHPATAAPAPDFWPLTGISSPPAVPVLTVYSKSDLLAPAGQRPGGMLVSALTGEGVSELITGIAPYLSSGPFEFDADQVGTQPMRFIAAEYVREAAFGMLEDEIPYSIAVEVEEFRETTTPVYVRVTILVERDSQKGIVIGRGGERLKAIGSQARHRLEELLGEQVFLECWVKVLPNWRRQGIALTRLGFPEP
jgi:GTPase